MTFDEALTVGFPIEWLPTDLTSDESKVSRCDDCGATIKVYSDARWRLTQHPIRCPACVEMLQREWGHTYFDAAYVS